MGYTTLQRTGTRRPSGPSALADAALTLIREGCQNLRFRADKTQAEQTQGYLGTSLRPHEIPYAMQMDVERLCLEKALERFLSSGTREDAFDVYFCYLEMFVGDYEKTSWSISVGSKSAMTWGGPTAPRSAASGTWSASTRI